MHNKKYLIRVRRSRRAYVFAYLMATIVALLLGYTYYAERALSPVVLIVSCVFIIVAIKFPEFYRIKDWWAITENSIIQSKGIFSKNIREINFSSISDLDLDQSFLKRFLNYGDVNVRLFLNETSIKIDNISKPGEFIEKLQKIISMDRDKRDGIRKA